MTKKPRKMKRNKNRRKRQDRINGTEDTSNPGTARKVNLDIEQVLTECSYQITEVESNTGNTA